MTSAHPHDARRLTKLDRQRAVVYALADELEQSGRDLRGVRLDEFKALLASRLRRSARASSFEGESMAAC